MSETEWLDTAEASQVFKIDQRTLANWRWRGCGPAYSKAGGKVLYRHRDVEAWLDRQTVRPNS